MTPNGKAKYGIYRKGCFSGFFSYLMLQMKNENRYSGSYFCILFSVFKLGKGKRNLITLLLFSIMESENEKRKDGIYNTWLFSVYPVFILQKEKNENGYNGSYFYFSFLVWGLEKRKRMLSYPFSIFFDEIEKWKTKGRYIHGTNTRLHLVPGLMVSGSVLILGQVTQCGNPYLICVVITSLFKFWPILKLLQFLLKCGQVYNYYAIFKLFYCREWCRAIEISLLQIIHQFIVFISNLLSLETVQIH